MFIRDDFDVRLLGENAKAIVRSVVIFECPDIMYERPQGTSGKLTSRAVALAALMKGRQL
jgi:hypothetical protein